MKPMMLNCVNCGAVEEFTVDDNVAYCDDCGKKHSTDSLFVHIKQKSTAQKSFDYMMCERDR